MNHALQYHALTAERCGRIRALLLTWYAANARVLPWRLPAVSADAPYHEYTDRLYRCLLSETMLQQTQVKTVIAYYTKWLEKFPTMQDLAQASEEDVMACWAGLGYYSRARRLHEAAKYLVKHFVDAQTAFPHDPAYWIKNVPGVGPYTAGAIISISFDIPSAIVDGNVQRVLSRVLAIHGDTSTPKGSGSKLIWERAAQLVQGDEPGNLNQALMELGATICSPTAPSCQSCPIKSECTAFTQHRGKNPFSKQEEAIEDLCSICPQLKGSLGDIASLYPFKPTKKKQREESAVVFVIKRGEELYVQKKEKGLLAGLFDFPTLLDCDPIEKSNELQAKLMGSTIHLFSHIRRTSHILQIHADHAAGLMSELGALSKDNRWVRAEDLTTLGVSELCLKNARLALGKKRTAEKEVTKPSKIPAIFGRKYL